MNQVADHVPLAYRVVRGGLWVMASSYWMIGFGFVVNIFLTRILYPEAFGIYTLAIFFTQIYRLQPRLGLARAFAQYRENSGETYGTYFYLECLAAIGSILLGVSSLPLLARFGYSDLVRAISVILLIAAIMESFAAVGSTLLDKKLNFRQSSLVHSLAFPLSYIPAFWLAASGGGVWSLVVQPLVYNLMALAGVWWAVYRRLPEIRQLRWRFNPTLARHFLRFGITVGILTIVEFLATQLDSFFIGTFVGETTLGFYDRAYRLAQWPNLLLHGILARAAFFTYAQLQADPPRLRKTMEIVTWLIGAIGWPIALVMFITAPDLLSAVYGPDWIASSLFLRLLVIYGLLRPLGENATYLLVGLGKPGLTVKYNLIQVAILMLLGLLLTLRWGVIGTCIAMGVSLLIGVVLITRAAIQETQIRLGAILWPQIVVSLLVVGGYLALEHFTGLSTLPLLIRLIGKAVYASVSFCLLLFAFQPGETREKLRYFWKLTLQTRGHD